MHRPAIKLQQSNIEHDFWKKLTEDIASKEDLPIAYANKSSDISPHNALMSMADITIYWQATSL